MRYLPLLLILGSNTIYAVWDNKTQGDCSPIITGDLNNAKVEIHCPNNSLPQNVLRKFEKLLNERVRTERNLNDHIQMLRKQVRDWEKRYLDLQQRLEQVRRERPGDSSIAKAQQALQEGRFDDAAKLLSDAAHRADDLAAALHVQAASAYELALDFQNAKKEYNLAHLLKPKDLAISNDYANLLQKLHEREQAEKLYREALKLARKRAEHNPGSYKDKIAAILNNLAALVGDDPQRREEAERLYREALRIRRGLAEGNPGLYKDKVATTLNNLANLVGDDPQRREEAERLYGEALDVYRDLAEGNPGVYKADVAMTLNNLAALVGDDPQRREEAERLYREALRIHRELAERNPELFNAKVALVLSNFGKRLFFDWNQPRRAQSLLEEASHLYQPYAERSPSLFGNRYALASLLAVMARQRTNQKPDCKLLMSARQWAQMNKLKNIAGQLVEILGCGR